MTLDKRVDKEAFNPAETNNNNLSFLILAFQQFLKLSRTAVSINNFPRN